MTISKGHHQTKWKQLAYSWLDAGAGIFLCITYSNMSNVWLFAIYFLVGTVRISNDQIGKGICLTSRLKIWTKI